jgi:hypothetical protein
MGIRLVLVRSESDNSGGVCACMLRVLISEQQSVQTHIYIHEGKSVLDPQARLTQRAAMVMSASGASEACFDYVR